MRAARVDENHALIVKALRNVGAIVHSLAAVGGGCPDIVCGFRGETYLFEIKTEKGKVNDAQKVWHISWRGKPVAVVRSVEDACRAIGVMRG